MGISTYFHANPLKASNAEEPGVYHVFEVHPDGIVDLVQTFEGFDDYWRDYELLVARRADEDNSMVTIVDSSDLDIEDADMSDEAFNNLAELAHKTAQVHLTLPPEQQGRVGVHIHGSDLAPLHDLSRHQGYSVYELYSDGVSGGMTGPLEASDYDMNFRIVKENALGRGQTYAGMATLIDAEGAGYDMDNEFEDEDDFAAYELQEEGMYSAMMYLADVAITGRPVILPPSAPAAQVDPEAGDGIEL